MVSVPFEFTMDWKLNPESKVVIAGAYKGIVAMNYWERWQPYLYLFEPQDWACDILREQFKDKPKVSIGEYGLGIEDGKFKMGKFGTDGCSFSADCNQRGTGRLRKIDTVFEAFGLSHVDLFVMNMEQYEFKLLPYMFEQGMIKTVDKFLVQFHGCQSQETMEYIRKGMMKTHNFTDPGIGCWSIWEKRNGH